jgi:hypothetical protein
MERMKTWKKSIDIKRFIDNWRAIGMEKAYEGIKVALRDVPEFADLEGDSDTFWAEFEDAAIDRNVSEFDWKLSSIYDRADEENVWLGL